MCVEPGFLILVAVVVFVAGPILGIVAFFANRGTRREVERLVEEVRILRKVVYAGGFPNPASAQATPAPLPVDLPVATPPPPASAAETAAPFVGLLLTRDEGPDLTDAKEPAATEFVTQAITTEDPQGIDEALAAMRGRSPAAPVAPPLPPAPPPPIAPPFSAAAPPPPRPASVELMLGTKWLNWVGALFMIMFVGYALKYSYDNAWIGPKGRLVIGALFGMAAITAGEVLRRRKQPILFQALTGVGIATWYACVFFSFQVYRLASPTLAFGLAIGVTATAVALAVVHNAIAIAVIAVIGGFLSPILLSTGENHPYAFFTYLLILDLVAICAAYFRRWPALDLLCFAGTALMLSGWYAKFGSAPGQLQPGLMYTSLFYVVFLVVPLLHTMVRRLPETRHGTTLVVANAIFSAAMYYRMLYPQHSHALGYIVLGQAALVFILFRAWASRLGAANHTAHSLLLIALGLAVAAVPLHMSRYGLAIVWALQGVLLTYAGLRYRSNWTRGVGLLALVLAFFSLFDDLPLHRAAFVPVLNMPFASWLLVGTAACMAAWLTWKRSEPADPYRQQLFGALFLIGFAITWLLPAFEISWHFRWNFEGQYRTAKQLTGIVVVWSLLSAALVTAMMRRREEPRSGWHVLVGAAYILTTLSFLSSLTEYKSEWRALFANTAFLPRVVFIAAVFWAAACYQRRRLFSGNQVLETLGHLAVAALVAVEIVRWANDSDAISDRLAVSLISVAWGAHAFVLLWLGLASRRRFRRVLGFALFAVVVLKVLLVDTSELEKVYRILSFGGTGLLLLAAGYFFQKYSALLLSEEEAQGRPDVS